MKLTIRCVAMLSIGLSPVLVPVFAQTSGQTFQLPAECLQRQVTDPAKCVIQDGPPRVVARPNSALNNGASGLTGSNTTPASKSSSNASASRGAGR